MNVNRVKLAASLTIVANIGVILGLIIVAYEVNQNSRLARAALISEGNTASNEMFVPLMGENPSDAIARAYECPETMDFSDFVVVDTYLWTGVSSVYRNYLLAKEGLLTDVEWKLEVDRYAAWYFGSGFPREWWFTEGEPAFEPEFTAHMRTNLDEGDETIYAWWQALRLATISTDADASIVSTACQKRTSVKPANKAMETDT